MGRFVYGNVKISKTNWDVFLNLLIKTLLIDASNIDQFLKIILSYRPFVSNRSKQKISIILHRLIEEHLILNHSFEVSWALWIFKSFKIKCESDIIKKIFTSEDYISKLICLDIINAKLYRGRRPSITSLTRDLHSNDLMTDKWLFSYEAIKQGWLNPTRPIIDGNEYMKIMYEYDIKFYNGSNQIKTDFMISDRSTVHKTKLLEFEVDELVKSLNVTKPTSKENAGTKSEEATTAKY